MRARVLTDFPDRLTRLREALLGGRGTPRPAVIRSCRIEPSRRFAVFHFSGCDSIEDAERLVGCEVQVPASRRQPLPPGTYYAGDLVGCEVIESGAGRRWGRVREVQATGEEVAGAPILVVERDDGGELLVPMAAEICTEIDLAGRKIAVLLPEGLAELNRE